MKLPDESPTNEAEILGITADPRRRIEELVDHLPSMNSVCLEQRDSTLHFPVLLVIRC